MQCRDNISEEASAPALPAALAPILPPGSYCPVRIQRVAEGVIAAYDPTRESRQSVWAALVDLFGPLLDVTPAVAL